MFIIARNTIKEFIRNKILYIILALSVGMIFLSMILSKLALSEGTKVILDFTLMVIEIFGLITTLFLGSYLIYNEIVKNTILLILSKNPSRKNFIIGKFLGFSVILGLLYLVLTLAFVGVVFIHNIGFEFTYLYAILLSYIKIIIVLGILVFFSTFISPFLSLLVSLLIYIISHMIIFVKFYLVLTERVVPGSFVEKTINVFYYVFPNFHDLSMKEFLYSPNLSAYSGIHMGLSVTANLIYLAIILFFAVKIFTKKEF